MNKRTNVTRGFMKLWVWQEAKNLFEITCKVYLKFPYELRRVVTNQIASVDSVHRNIAEGYCRKSKKEYLRFLDIAIASLAESTSSNHVYLGADQITKQEFEQLDVIAYKLENGLRKLIESVRRKNDDDWNDSFGLREPSLRYEKAAEKKDRDEIAEKERWELWNEY